MKQRMVFLLLVLASLILFPGYLAAQGGDPPPPPCCGKVTVPPPRVTSAVQGMDSTGTMSEIIISDSTLKAAGFTRSEFLNRIAVAIFTDSTADLFFPFVVQTTDTTTDLGVESAPVQYLQISSSLVTPEVLGTLDLLYISDGQACIKVVFVSDGASAGQ